MSNRGKGKSRGRGRGRGKSDSNAPIRRRMKRQKNQPIVGRDTRLVSGNQLREWQKLPITVLREWCQQHRRKTPYFKPAYISNAELASFAQKWSINLENAASKAYRSKVILPNNGSDRNKDLSFSTREIYKTQKYSQHMTALLALHTLCPSLPLERKLPSNYAAIWSSFSSQSVKVHATSKYKSRHEAQTQESVRSVYRKRRERAKDQYEFERWAHLKRVHMNEELREHIQNVLREQYTKICDETKQNDRNSHKQQIFHSLQSFYDKKSIVRKCKDIEEKIAKDTTENGPKIHTFVHKMVERLKHLGFGEKDAKHAALLTAGVDFISNKETIDEYIVDEEHRTFESGTKVVKQYAAHNYDLNVNKYVDDAVTWCCLHLNEDQLPRKYAARGKQFEVFVSEKKSNEKEDDSESDEEDTQQNVRFDNSRLVGIYYWLIRFGFRKKITTKIINENKDASKYVILGKLFRLLVEEIGSEPLKKTLNLTVDDEMLSESDEAIKSELEDSLPFVFENVKINNKDQDYIWSKTFEFKNGRKGMIEMYRIMECEGFNCYPQQIPIITFCSPNNSISHKYCAQIMQCLIKEASTVLNEDISFTLMSWLQQHIDALLRDPNDALYKTKLLGKDWKMNANNDTIKEEKEEKEIHEKAEKKLLFNKLFSVRKEKSLKVNQVKDEWLLHKLNKKAQCNKKYQQYTQLRQALPAYKCRDTIINLTEKHQVVVISGETGCGKSTQIPQFILDHYIQTKRGSLCNIIVTQPRRISAVGLAERVSTERCEAIGNTVGFSIRLENKMSQETQLLYCTTGILLRRLMTSLKIQSISHVIIDEVHERSTDIDFLMVILKFLIQTKRKDLKVILMSATLNAKLFSEYFGDCPVLQIPGRTFPVKQFYLEDLLSSSPISLPRVRWSKILKEEERMRAKQLKEKDIYKKRLNLYSDRVFSELAKWDERQHHRTEISLVVNTILHIIKAYPLTNSNNNKQAILVFLSGMYEIRQTERMLTDKLIAKQMDLNEFWLIPLHSSLPTMNQRQIFETPPYGVRKVVLSTNIAETSITINDVKYVIDCGKMRQMSFDASRNISVLEETWISRAHSEQRQGRAGRVGAGICYKLYSLDKYRNDMCQSPVAELLRSSLENVALQIKLIRTLAKNIKKNKDNGAIKATLEACIEAPKTELIETSVAGLYDVGALDKNELLTALGFHLAKLPVSNVRLGKMLIYGAIFECLSPILIIAAILTGKSIYRSSRDPSNQILLKKKYYGMSGKSDHITMYKIYVEWKKKWLSYGVMTAKQFAYEHSLSHIALQQIDGITKQYTNALREIRFVDDTYNFSKNMIEMNHKLDTNSKSVKLIKSILTAGLYPNVIRVKMPKKKYDKTLSGQMERDADTQAIRFYLHPRYNTTGSGRIFIHRQSCVSCETQFECDYLIYLTKIQMHTRLQAYDVSMTSSYALLFFGGELNVDHNKQHIILDNWIRFIAPSRIAVLVNELKKMLNYLLIKKIANPQIDIANEPVIKAIQTLLKTDGL